MARYRRRHDGGAAHQREIHQPFSGRPLLVTGMRFEFATATRIAFGPGVLRELQPKQFGKQALVVGSRNASRLAPLIEMLERDGVTFTHYAVGGEPTIELVS